MPLALRTRTPLLLAALASVPFEFVLVRVRVLESLPVTAVPTTTDRAQGVAPRLEPAREVVINAREPPSPRSYQKGGNAEHGATTPAMATSAGAVPETTDAAQSQSGAEAATVATYDPEVSSKPRIVANEGNDIGDESNVTKSAFSKSLATIPARPTTKTRLATRRNRKAPRAPRAPRSGATRLQLLTSGARYGCLRAWRLRARNSRGKIFAHQDPRH